MAEAPIQNLDEETLDGQPVGGDDDNAAPTGTPPRVDLSQVPKEMMPFIEAARSQEKAKLYPQLMEARKKVRDMENRVAAQVAAAPGGDVSEVGELKALVLSLQDTIVKRDRDSNLRAYRAEKIGELKAQGIRLVESLVQGDSEEQIDLALEVAKAERAQIEAEIAAEQEAAPAPRGPKTVTVNNGRHGRPEGVPPTTQPGRAGESGPQMTAEELKELTSMDAIRDGRYKANKNRIMAALRNQAVISGAGRA